MKKNQKFEILYLINIIILFLVLIKKYDNFKKNKTLNLIFNT